MAFQLKTRPEPVYLPSSSSLVFWIDRTELSTVSSFFFQSETMENVKLHEEEGSAIVALGSLLKLTEVHLSLALFAPFFKIFNV